MPFLEQPPLHQKGLTLGKGLENSFFTVKHGLKNVLSLQSGLVEAAHLAKENKGRGILLLTKPRLSDNRLSSEWRKFLSIVDPGLAPGIALVCHKETGALQVFGHLTEEETQRFSDFSNQSQTIRNKTMRSPASSHFEILRVLIIHFFRKSGPLPIKQICKESGYSYPSVGKVLSALQTSLKRHSDRSVELNSFPSQSWARLIATASENRASLGFYVPAGKPRSTESLLKKVRLTAHPDIALGGIIAARQDLPGIDLVGIHRLDLTWRYPTESEVTAFIRRLDPALKPAQPGTLPQVVIHHLHRPEPLFRQNSDQNLITDEVESLCDLYEARMVPQAAELLEHLTRKTQS